MSNSHPRLNYVNVCVYCSKEFHPFCRKAKYCSNRCKDLNRRKGEVVKCSYCTKGVYKKRKLFGRIKLFYCSRQCKNLDARYTTANKELQAQARRAVRSRIIKGEIIRKNCEICGKKAGAHHYLGYAKEHWLDVKWLCISHHSLEHQNYIRGKH